MESFRSVKEFIYLFQTGHVFDLFDNKIRAQKYPYLDLKKVARILEKYVKVISPDIKTTRKREVKKTLKKLKDMKLI